jgi:hypothetical protein
MTWSDGLLKLSNARVANGTAAAFLVVVSALGAGRAHAQFTAPGTGTFAPDRAAVAASDSQRAPHWRGALGAGVTTPGGPGLLAELRPVPPVVLRAVLLGVHGTTARGIGIGLSMGHTNARFYASGLVGEVRCTGDPDTPTCPNSPGASFAWAAAAGLDFEVAAESDWAFGIEVSRWTTRIGPTLDFQEQPSRTFAGAFVRRLLR